MVDAVKAESGMCRISDGASNAVVFVVAEDAQADSRQQENKDREKQKCDQNLLYLVTAKFLSLTSA